MLVSFEEFVERANRARTTDELVKEFLATVRQHGLDRMIFCLQTAHDHIDMKPGVGVIQNYPGVRSILAYGDLGNDTIDCAGVFS